MTEHNKENLYSSDFHFVRMEHCNAQKLEEKFVLEFSLKNILVLVLLRTTSFLLHFACNIASYHITQFVSHACRHNAKPSHQKERSNGIPLLMVGPAWIRESKTKKNIRFVNCSQPVLL